MDERKAAEDYEDTSIGGLTWHCTEEDGGPDVGISVYIGPNDHIWCGEISKKCFEEASGAEHFSSDGGWFIVRYNPRPTLIAKCGDIEDGRQFIEQVAAWIKEAHPV